VTDRPRDATPPGISWWRRNRWALLALGVLLPATVVLTASSEWFDYQNDIYSQAIRVSPSDTADYAGATFGIVDSVVIAGGSPKGDEVELDHKLDLVVAILEVTPGSNPSSSCTLSIGARSSENPDKRRWDANTDLPPGFPYDGDLEQDCDDEMTEPYRLQAAATVPHGAADDEVWVQVEVYGQQPRYLELMLPDSSESMSVTSSSATGAVVLPARRRQ
jgi:hypothetical protein